MNFLYRSRNYGMVIELPLTVFNQPDLIVKGGNMNAKISGLFVVFCIGAGLTLVASYAHAENPTEGWDFDIGYLEADIVNAPAPTIFGKVEIRNSSTNESYGGVGTVHVYWEVECEDVIEDNTLTRGHTERGSLVVRDLRNGSRTVERFHTDKTVGKTQDCKVSVDLRPPSSTHTFDSESTQVSGN